MKTVFAVCMATFAFVQVSAFGQLPAPQYGSILEDFDIGTVTPGDQLDTVGANNESVQRTDGPTATQFAWGAYDAGSGQGIDLYQISGAANPTPPPELTALSFFDAGRAVGSYAYTVFDNTPGDGNNNVSSIALNMSGQNARVVLTTVQSGDTRLALLVRSGESAWYQSDDKLVAASANFHVDPPRGTIIYEFTGARAVGWTLLSGTDDMNQVDNGGETALTEAGSAAPDLGNITGVGVRITDVAGSTGGFTGLTVTEIELIGPDAPPLAAAENWEIYE
jgi:hypothetical protein